MKYGGCWRSEVLENVGEKKEDEEEECSYRSRPFFCTMKNFHHGKGKKCKPPQCHHSWWIGGGVTKFPKMKNQENKTFSFYSPGLWFEHVCVSNKDSEIKKCVQTYFPSSLPLPRSTVIYVSSLPSLMQMRVWKIFIFISSIICKYSFSFPRGFFSFYILSPLFFFLFFSFSLLFFTSLMVLCSLFSPKNHSP